MSNYLQRMVEDHIKSLKENDSFLCEGKKISVDDCLRCPSYSKDACVGTCIKNSSGTYILFICVDEGVRLYNFQNEFSVKSFCQLNEIQLLRNDCFMNLIAIYSIFMYAKEKREKGMIPFETIGRIQ